MTRKPTAPPSPETRNEVLKVIRTTNEPMTASQLAKLLVAPHKLAEKALAPILDEYVAIGVLRDFPKKTAKGKPRYWDRDVTELGRSLIVAALNKKGSQSKADLRKAAKPLKDAEFQSVFQSLIDSRTLFEHPPLPKKKSALFGSQPPAPEPYLKDVGVQLTKVVAQLTEANVSRDELRWALVQLIEAAGIPFGSPAIANDGATRARPTSVDLVSLMRQIEPGADNGALVPARNLRRAAKLDKREFDRTVLDLARNGRLTLHRHDFATSLSAAEQDELVSDGEGTFYVGMALRRGTN